MAAGHQRLRLVLLSAALILPACAPRAPQQLQAESAAAIAATQESAAAVVAPAAETAQAESAAAIAATQERAAAVVAPTAETVQETAAAAIVPAVLQLQEAVQETIQEALPEPAPVTAAAPAPPLVSPAGVALIVRWEVTSPAVYTRKYERPVWPGGASGATIGIGDDLGHQTRYTIGASWAQHAQLDRLLPAAGVIGQSARQLVGALRDVRTPYPLAEEVFASSVLPRYHGLTRRTFANGWDGLIPAAQDSLVSTVYNRGASMAGGRRAEMRVLRDQCVPAADYACMAKQYRSMCRLWQGTPEGKGLCARYEATARFVESAA